MIKAIIVDNEPKDLTELKMQLEMSGFLEIKGIFRSPLQALKAVKNIKIDAIFLDIEMSEMNGITLAKEILDIDAKISVVFVTAVKEYAVDAFRLNAVDYILKPTTTDRINKTLERIINKKSIVLEEQLKIKVNCFGKFKVRYGNSEEEIKWRTKKAEETFAYLINSMGRGVNKYELMENIFEQFDKQRAYQYLKISIYYIKKIFSVMGIEGVVKNIKGGYRLNVEQIDCDYYEIISFYEKHKLINTQNIGNYEKLINLYTGGYFEKNYYNWSQGESENIKEMYINLLIKVAEYYRSKGNFKQAASILKKGLKVDKLNRELNKKIIEIYIGENDRIAATKHFDTYKRKLKIEIGLKVDEEMKNMLR